jgi:TM2 domain-containing membrane protein YozV
MIYAPAYAAARPHKDPGIAALLALFLGFLGILGIGHIYAGKLAKGLILLVVGLLFAPLAFIFIFFSFVPFIAMGRGIGLGLGAALLVVVVILGVAWLAIRIWSTVDAYRTAEEYNARVAVSGVPPW